MNTKNVRWTLNDYAKSCHKYEDIVEACELLGANNYAEIFWAKEHTLRTCVYLINKCNVIGEKENIYPETMRFYLKGGAGAVLDYFPELLENPLAEPYITRRKAINDILIKLLNRDVISIIYWYTSYDMTALPEEEFAALEKAYEERNYAYMGTPPDTPLSSDDSDDSD